MQKDRRDRTAYRGAIIEEVFSASTQFRNVMVGGLDWAGRSDIRYNYGTTVEAMEAIDKWLAEHPNGYKKGWLIPRGDDPPGPGDPLERQAAALESIARSLAVIAGLR